MRTTAKKDVVATATAGIGRVVTSLFLPALLAKRKRKRPHPVEPTSGQNGTEAERMCAIPQLDSDGNISLGSETASQPATPPLLPPPPLQAMPPPPTTPPPPTPSDPATIKSLCIHVLLLLSSTMSKECLEKFVGKNALQYHPCTEVGTLSVIALQR
jgi:hypothetical protein